MMKAREMALQTLVKVCQQGSYSNLALKSMLENSTDRRENALASLLVYGVLQQMLRLDYIISKFSSVKMKKLSPNILNILRLGVYQLFFTDKIPPSAAVNESVVLARKYGHGASAGFVNAVLRAIQRGEEGIEYPSRETPADYLSVYYSYPKWYCDYLIGKLGYNKTEQVLKAGNEPPDFSLRVNTLKTNRDAVLKSLAEQGFNAVAGESDEAIILKEGTDISKVEEYKQGLIQPQDGASMLVSRVLNPQSGQTVVDCCSAPGGKTTHMAQLMGNKGEIIAFDIHPSRVNLVKEAAKRAGCDIIKATTHDATVCMESLIGKADKVLVDVPCSGLGIVRRKPEIKYSVEPKGIKELSELQYSILKTCSKYLKIGGELVYSTCTVMDEENVEVLDRFLAENQGYEAMPETGASHIQFYPGDHGYDGFFISKIRRKV